MVVVICSVCGEESGTAYCKQEGASEYRHRGCGGILINITNRSLITSTSGTKFKRSSMKREPLNRQEASSFA